MFTSLLIDYLDKVTAPSSTKIPVALPETAADRRISFYAYDLTDEWVLNYVEMLYKKTKDPVKFAKGRSY